MDVISHQKGLCSQALCSQFQSVHKEESVITICKYMYIKIKEDNKNVNVKFCTTDRYINI